MSARSHVAEIERCNQRGGRMLSVVDLIDAGTLVPAAAGYLLAAIRGGASFMVGARPGGAGKTTVMGALLNFVPAGVDLVPADSVRAIADGIERPAPRRCWICHEIGAGSYYAYLWEGALRAYFELGRAGHMMATNLHADTMEEARTQVCDGNGVPAPDFARMNLAVFLRVRGGARIVHEIWESDGASPHRCVFRGGRLETGVLLADSASLESAGGAVESLRASGARTILEVREFLAAQGAV